MIIMVKKQNILFYQKYKFWNGPEIILKSSCKSQSQTFNETWISRREFCFVLHILIIIFLKLSKLIIQNFHFANYADDSTNSINNNTIRMCHERLRITH